ncbi:MAG: DUF2255 family protein [Streptococcaceae bacterium]|jgi:hypothetical protein|nr:DUF2255 family protein [Streptococcaceae bacterium]
MKILGKDFSDYRDIYVCPDPQGHRPTWIWFAIVGDDMYVAASGPQSSWSQAAAKSGTGQLHVAGDIYQVTFTKVTDAETLKTVEASYLSRYNGSSAPDSESQKSVMRVGFLEKIGPSDLPKAQKIKE